MAVALVIFARWNLVQCLYASLLFGGAQAIGPALQSVALTPTTTGSTPRPNVDPADCGDYLFAQAPLTGAPEVLEQAQE